MLLVQKEAPAFESMAVFADNSIRKFTLEEVPNGQKIVLFFYPLDFTFVCPSEIIALDKRLAEFEQRNATVLLISVDSHFTHLAYKNTPLEQGGIGQIKITMISDLNKKISTDYGVLSNEGIAFRGTFILDQDTIVRHQSVNDLPIGRSVDEILRTIDAIDHTREHGEVCPANWRKGDTAMTPNPTGVKNYLQKYTGK